MMNMIARARSLDNTVLPQLCIYDKNKGCELSSLLISTFWSGLLSFRYLSSSVFMRVRLHTCETVIECVLRQFHYDCELDFRWSKQFKFGENIR